MPEEGLEPPDTRIMIPPGFGSVEPKALEMAHGWRTNPKVASMRSAVDRGRTASRRVGLQADGYQPPWPSHLRCRVHASQKPRPRPSGAGRTRTLTYAVTLDTCSMASANIELARSIFGGLGGRRLELGDLGRPRDRVHGGRWAKSRDLEGTVRDVPRRPGKPGHLGRLPRQGDGVSQARPRAGARRRSLTCTFSP
jgi:hypothetical protein